jgi:hypothetical protein
MDNVKMKNETKNNGNKTNKQKNKKTKKEVKKYGRWKHKGNKSRTESS